VTQNFRAGFRAHSSLPAVGILEPSVLTDGEIFPTPPPPPGYDNCDDDDEAVLSTNFDENASRCVFPFKACSRKNYFF
jgi:hypothetical protein